MNLIFLVFDERLVGDSMDLDHLMIAVLWGIEHAWAVEDYSSVERISLWKRENVTKIVW